MQSKEESDQKSKQKSKKKESSEENEQKSESDHEWSEGVKNDELWNENKPQEKQSEFLNLDDHEEEFHPKIEENEVPL